MQYIFIIVFIDKQIKTSNETTIQNTQIRNKKLILSGVIKEEHALCEVTDTEVSYIKQENNIYYDREHENNDNSIDLPGNAVINNAPVLEKHLTCEESTESIIQSYYPSIKHTPESCPAFSSVSIRKNMTNQVDIRNSPEKTNTEHSTYLSSFNKDIKKENQAIDGFTMNDIKQEHRPYHSISNDLRGIKLELTEEITNIQNNNDCIYKSKEIFPNNINCDTTKSLNSSGCKNTSDRPAESNSILRQSKRKFNEVLCSKEANCTLTNKKICIDDSQYSNTDISSQIEIVCSIDNNQMTNEQNMKNVPNVNNSAMVISPLENKSCTEGDYCINTQFKIDFDEKIYCGKSTINHIHHNFRVLFDFNISNIDQESKNINLVLTNIVKKSVIDRKLSVGLKHIYNDLNHSFMNANNPISYFKDEFFKPTICYLFQILNKKFRSQNVYTNYMNFDIIKSLFNPIYPFVRIIDFQRCSEDVKKFYSDFKKLFESLIFLRKLMIMKIGNYDVFPEAAITEEYEALLKKLITSSTCREKIENIELELEKLKYDDNKLEHLEKISEIFDSHFCRFRLYLKEKNKNSKLTNFIHYKRKIILLCRIMCYKYIHKDQNSVFIKDIVEASKNIPVATHLTNLDIKTLFILCTISINQYIIFQTRNIISQIILPIEKKIMSFVKKTRLKIENLSEMPKNTRFYSYQTKQLLLSQNKQNLNLKTYNLIILAVTDFSRSYNEFSTFYTE